MTSPKPAYKRILLKLSGEALMGDDAFGINRATIVRIVDEVAEVINLGVEVAIVIGGGNISAPISAPRKAAAVSVVKKGLSLIHI